MICVLKKSFSSLPTLYEPIGSHTRTRLKTDLNPYVDFRYMYEIHKIFGYSTSGRLLEIMSYRPKLSGPKLNMDKLIWAAWVNGPQDLSLFNWIGATKWCNRTGAYVLYICINSSILGWSIPFSHHFRNWELERENRGAVNSVLANRITVVYQLVRVDTGRDAAAIAA